MGVKKKSGAYVIAVAIAVVSFLILIIAGISAQNSLRPSEQPKDGSGIVFGSVVFNEMLLSNDNFYPDGNGEFFDYVEFRNTTASPIDLTGWYISEDSNQTPWYFPDNTVIDPNGYLLVYFCGEVKSGLYSSMKLSKQGREVFTLYSPDAVLIDRALTAETERNLVYERTPSDSWKANEQPSPFYPNTDEGKALFAASRVRKNDPVKITEVMAQNLFTLTDSDGDYSDYIEITNFSDREVDLEGYYLSNDATDFYKWSFPSVTLDAGESIIVFASGKDRLSEKEPHLSFRLASDGESIYLCDRKGVLLDEISYADLSSGKVLVRNEQSAEPELVRTPSPYYTDLDSYSRENDSQKDLLINEVMVINDSYAVQNGEYFDWIEIKNNSDKTVVLSDYYLTQNKNVPNRWQFPAVTLAPDEYILIYASGSPEKSTQTFIHCDFKLDSIYEELYLYKADGESFSLCDGAVLTEIPYGMSYGRSPSKGGFVYISSPTPGGVNNDGLRYISSVPTPSVEGGIYDGIETLSVSFSSEGTVYYTLDGSVPTESSAVYNSPLTVDSTAVIRAVSKEDGKYPSPVITESYIVNENHTLPVVSLVSDPEGLWSEQTGICFRGEPDEKGAYSKSANIWQDWERSCNVELFDGIWGFSADCGVKLFGQSNREYPKQSFQLKFRAKYGDPEIYCSLFDNVPEITRFENLVLRSGSQDYRRTVFRDELCTSLLNNTDLLVQGYKACILYINGEYYGIYYLREKIDETFIASHIGVSEESIDLLVGNGNIIHGSNDDWYSVLWYVQNYDLSDPSNYNYLKKRVDVENFADFIIMQAFFGNRDSGNTKFYRSSETDNKWRWIAYDLDYGMTEDYNYSLWFMIDPEGTGYAHKYNTKLINGLLRSPEFFDMFLRRFAYHLDNTFEQDHIVSQVDYFRSLIGDEIRRNIDKWGNSYNSWDWQTKVIKYFVTDKNDSGLTRKDQLISEITTLFSLTDKAVEYYFYMTDDQRAEFDLAVELGLIENAEEIFIYTHPADTVTEGELNEA